MTAPSECPEVDYGLLADQLLAIRTQMAHHEEPRLHGREFDAEALRRWRRLDHSMTPNAEVEWLIESHQMVNLQRIATLERQIAEQYSRHREELADIRKGFADALRSWCNERTVPAKFRREGVLLAADWLYPAAPPTPVSPEEPTA